MAPIRTQAIQNALDACIEQTIYVDGVLETRFFCIHCDGSVARQADFYRHMRKHSTKGLFYCRHPGCTHEDGFTQKSNRDQHVKSVHLGQRYRCPHLWEDAEGNQSRCSESFSDPPGLIRHRSLRHGFETGDDAEKIEDPTPVGMKFPNSKYANRNKRKANDDDGGLVAKARARRPKRAKATPAGPSSAAESSRCAPKPTERTSKKATSAPKQEQQLDWSAMYTLPASQSPTPSPVTVSEWHLGFDCLTNNQLNMQPQPASGMNAAEPPALPYLSLPAQVDSFDALFLSEPQTTAAPVDNWSLCAQMANFDFSFTASALPPAAAFDFDGTTIDPSMLTVAAPIVAQTPEQAGLVNMGFASGPGYFDPAQSMMSWQTEGYPATSPGSSRESTASPDFSMFVGMQPWVSTPLPSEPVPSDVFGF